MSPKNLVIIMSDQHTRNRMGCYGDDFVKTPNLDKLAQQGTRFTNCWTPSPVCVPARACFATGKYTHQVGHWGNADAYDGAIPSWHHHLRDSGHEVTSIGKLHFKSEEDDNGFTESIIPMHVIDGKGDLLGLIRDEGAPVRGGAYKMKSLAGPGESVYTQYDRDIAARAQVWLQERKDQNPDKPFVLFVSFVCPHYPLTAPPEHYYRYYNDPNLPMPRYRGEGERATHPFLKDYAETFNFDEHFKTEDDIRRAVAGYFGLCSFMDEQAGKVIDALESTGLRGETSVVYTSDHGDALGQRGLWGKSTMHDEILGVPMIASGAGIPQGAVVDTPVTLLDIYPFIFETVGEPDHPGVTAEHPGVSLTMLANGTVPDRNILSEYHGMGSRTGAFAIRHGKYKYIHYVAYPPQLFDLEANPEELNDLGADPASADALAECRARLEAMLDPEEVDGKAKSRQHEILDRNGGREAVIMQGDLGFSPPPGVAPTYN